VCEERSNAGTAAAQRFNDVMAPVNGTRHGARQWDNAAMNPIASPTASSHAAPSGRVFFPWPIFLVGMMGAGKTTLGRRLAQVLGRRFIDLDHELEARCGVRIATIFDIEGEAGFRQREAALLDEHTRAADVVLATGGGAVLRAENREHLRARGVVVYLHASVEKLHRRTRHDRNRPLLAGDDPRGTLAALLAARDPLYREVADVVIDTGSLSQTGLTDALLARLQSVQKTLQPLPELSS